MALFFFVVVWGLTGDPRALCGWLAGGGGFAPFSAFSFFCSPLCTAARKEVLKLHYHEVVLIELALCVDCRSISALSVEQLELAR